jgi:two-component system, chemotaxis family, chemotaxis protein CheY
MSEIRLPILIVDSFGAMRRTIRAMLQQFGVRNIMEDGGEKALELLRTGNFGLVIADMVMAPVSGLDILRAVRADERLKHLPVILTTPAPQEALVVAAKELKVDGILVKPFDTNTLKRIVAAAMARESAAQHAATLAAGPAQPAAGEKDESEELRRLKKDIMTLSQQLQRRIGMGAALLQEDAVKLIRAYMARALELGVEREYTDQLDALLEQLTKAAEAERQEQEKKEPLGALPSDGRRGPRRNAAQERRAEAEARRRHKRFVAPPLDVAISGKSYRTDDWSIGGLSVVGWASSLSVGKQIKVDLAIAGIADPEARFTDQMIVVRSSPDTGKLALRFKTLSSATLHVLEYLTRHRFEAREAPEPEPDRED